MDEWGHIVSLGISAVLVPVVGGIIAAFGMLWRRLLKAEADRVECLEKNAKMSVEVATVKAFMQSRAFLEALAQNRMRVGGEPNDFAAQFQQVYVRDRERTAFAAILPDLKKWYVTPKDGVAPCSLSTEDLFMAVMRDWDQTFVGTVCPKLDVANAACCLYAMCLLRETEQHDAHGELRQN